MCIAGVLPASLEWPLPLREPPSVNHRTLRGRCQMPAASNSPSEVVGSGPPSQPVNCPAGSGGVCGGVTGDPAGADADPGPAPTLTPVKGSLVASEEAGLPCALIASESTTKPDNATGVSALERIRETARQRLQERFEQTACEHQTRSRSPCHAPTRSIRSSTVASEIRIVGPTSSPRPKQRMRSA